MGYQVRQYSLDELRRISLPGKVAPSLFWALPIGNWDQGELELLWRHFTSNSGSNCSEFGLLLVQNAASLQGTPDSDLQGVGAALEHLLPEGTDRYLDKRLRPNTARQLLILSSAYPQPGWGVLVPIPDGKNADNAVSKIVNAAIEKLGDDNIAATGKMVLKNAGKHFRDWKSLENARPNATAFRELDECRQTTESTSVIIEKLKQSITAGKTQTLPNSLIELINKFRTLFSLEYSEVIDRLHMLRKSVMVATDIIAASADQLANEVEPRLVGLKTDPQLMGNVLRICKNRSVKAAIRAGLELEKLTASTSDEPLLKRAELLLSLSLTSIAEELEALAPLVRKKYTDTCAKSAVALAESEIAQREWRARSSAARGEFHCSISLAAEIQWRLGPSMLMAFESVTPNSEFRPLVVPWDPARMVGWKIQASNIALTLLDLKLAASEIGVDAPSTDTQEEMNTAVDGSYFTDYVHFIAVSKPGDSPRLVTQRLLASLLRPAELRKLCTRLEDGESSAPADDRQILANMALSSMGWNNDVIIRKIPLAEWSDSLKKNSNHALTVATAVEVRKSLEGLCKDILNVITVQLGYSEEGFWDALQEQSPNYKPVGHNRIWADEISGLTAGSASLLMTALGPLAFPGKYRDVNECVVTLEVLTNHLNNPAHDRVPNKKPLLQQQISEEIDGLLTQCKVILGELPWHLSPSFVHGEQPKVICGEAWSHSQPVRRMLRVIAFSDHPTRQEIVIWNPTGTNPVIANPIFIKP